MGPFPVEGRTPIAAFGHKGATPFANPGIQSIILPVLAGGEILAPSPNHRNEVFNNSARLMGRLRRVTWRMCSLNRWTASTLGLYSGLSDSPGFDQKKVNPRKSKDVSRTSTTRVFSGCKVRWRETSTTVCATASACRAAVPVFAKTAQYIRYADVLGVRDGRHRLVERASR